MDIVNFVVKENFKGATKLYFMLSSCAVIILFKTDLYRSAFSTYSLEELFFQLFLLYVFLSILFRIQCHLWKLFIKHLCNYILYRYHMLRDFILTNKLLKFLVLTLYNLFVKTNRVGKNILPKRFQDF